jgi:hypothetical protein
MAQALLLDSCQLLLLSGQPGSLQASRQTSTKMVFLNTTK